LATTVYTVEDITLQDGTTVTLRPLNIKSLRKFMETMEDFAKVESENDGLEVLLDAAAICLMKENPQYWDKHAKDGKGTHSEDFEDVADMPTIYKILEVCGGVKLNDPNLMRGIEETPGLA
jgi:hypothetical protein